MPDVTFSLNLDSLASLLGADQSVTVAVDVDLLQGIDPSAVDPNAIVWNDPSATATPVDPAATATTPPPADPTPQPDPTPPPATTAPPVDPMAPPAPATNAVPDAPDAPPSPHPDAQPAVDPDLAGTDSAQVALVGVDAHPHGHLAGL